MSEPHARVLIVEDEADIRRFVRMTLQDQGFETFEADGVRRGLIEAGTRRPDLVVTNTVVAPWGAFAAKALGIPHAWFVREYGDLDRSEASRRQGELT